MDELDTALEGAALAVDAARLATSRVQRLQHLAYAASWISEAFDLILGDKVD